MELQELDTAEIALPFGLQDENICAELSDSSDRSGKAECKRPGKVFVKPERGYRLHIINNVILEYGSLASWKLSELSHKESSWKNARIGLQEGENGNRKLKLEDIREDAKKVRPYDHVWDMYYDEFDDEVME